MNNSNDTILRRVGDSEAFYFCRTLGNFTGQKANSLEEFLQKINVIEQESLEFHLDRQDFEKWLKSTIGDSKLATDMRRLRKEKLSGNDLRNLMLQLVSDRLKELTNVPESVIKTKKKKTRPT